MKPTRHGIRCSFADRRFGMKHVALALVIIVFAACAKKTGEDTYTVVTPNVDTAQAAEKTREGTAEAREKLSEGAKEVGQSVKEGVKDFAESPAGQQIGEGAREVGEGLKTAGREAAAATGRGLEKAGQEIQEHAKPGDQP